MIFRRNYSLLLIIVVVLVISFLSVGVLSKIKNNRISVRVSKAQVGSVQNYIDIKVIIKSNKYKEYYGNQLQVKNIHVKPGTYVEKGTTLLSFDNSDLEAQYTQAKIQLENAILQKNQMIINRENFERQKEILDKEIFKIEENQKENESFISEIEESFEDSRILSSKNSIRISDYSEELNDLLKEGEEVGKSLSDLKKQRGSLPEITNEQLKLLDNSIILAENNLKMLEDKIKSLGDLKAEFSGIVTDININKGSYSQAGSVILVLQDTKDLKGIALISKNNLSNVKQDQKVSINDPLGSYEGKIVSIGDVPVSAYESFKKDSIDNSLLAEIEIFNPNDRLKIDFDLNGKIILDDVKDVLKIPIESVVYDEYENPYVFLIKDSIAFKSSVVTGSILNNYIQIIEGVNPSDKIVINPPNNLSDKSRVKVVGVK